MKIHTLITAFVLPLGIASAQVSTFERDFGDVTGDVVVRGRSVQPAELQDIQLLGLDFVGRSRLTLVLPDQPRLNSDIPSNAARIVLPFEKGSLYKYRRGAVYGFFVVDPRGDAFSVLEVPGIGPGLIDPFPGRVSIAPDGASMLVATDAGAGGDLWEVDLLGGGAVNRTAGVAPHDFKSAGLMLLDAWGVAISDQGVLRFERAPGATAAGVALPLLVTRFGPDVVRSEDQSTVAFLAGDSISRAYVFTVNRTGDVLQASDRATSIRNAGFLPEVATGPHLALSTDGSWVAWRRAGSSNELYARQTGSGPRPTDMHLTGDANFSNTLSDTGVISFFSPDTLTTVIGRDENEGVGRGDVYTIQLSPGGLVSSNLSRTSGVFLPPYDYGRIDAFEDLFRIPGATPTFVALDRGRGRVIRFDTQGSPTIMASGVSRLRSVTLAGDQVVAEVQRLPGVTPPLDLVQFSTAAALPTVLSLPTGLHIDREAGMSSRNVFGGVMPLDTGGELLGRLTVPTTIGQSLTIVPRSYGPTTGLNADGTLYATMLAGANQLLVEWSDVDAVLLRICPGGTFILPGL